VLGTRAGAKRNCLQIGYRLTIDNGQHAAKMDGYMGFELSGHQLAMGKCSKNLLAPRPRHPCGGVGGGELREVPAAGALENQS
jgi:hypothetical protein